jgi:hypothetical protein
VVQRGIGRASLKPYPVPVFSVSDTGGHMRLMLFSDPQQAGSDADRGSFRQTHLNNPLSRDWKLASVSPLAPRQANEGDQVARRIIASLKAT